MQKHLTEAAVAKIKPDPLKRLEIHDAAVSGLRLRVSVNGRRSWSLMYKVAGEALDGGRGKNRRMTLGQYPLVDLRTARGKASNAKELADRGIDPASRKQAEVLDRAQKRIETLLPRFIELHAKPNTKRWRDTEKLLQREVASRWVGVDVTKITRAMVHELLDQISVSDNASKAREVRKHLSVFLNWAVDRGICSVNPMAGMKRRDLQYRARERVLSVPELREIWHSAEALGYPFGPIVQLLILTGQRRSEISKLCHRWIETDRIEIPAEYYKTRIPHIVPLTDRAASIIAAQPIWNVGDHVFSTTSGRTPSSGFSRAKRNFDKTTEVQDWTFHDIRRSVATHMAQAGVIQEHIERVLGHVIGGVVGTYNRYSYFEEKKRALLSWENKFVFGFDEI